MASGDATLFEESFTVMEYDQSKYDRVARIHCTSADSQTIMSLDINIELFPCAPGDSLHVVLTTTLALDGSKEEEKGWRDVGKGGDAPATIADLYDYVCHGKIYKFEETFDGNTMYVRDPKTNMPILCHELNVLTDCNLQQRLRLVRWSPHVAPGPYQEVDSAPRRQRLPSCQEIIRSANDTFI
jgi:DNA-directed RNA polymerase I, II, and III subunit RPABC3